MPKIVLNTIILILIFIISASWYFGAFLPLRKAQLLIVALQRAGEVKSLDEFKGVFSAALDFYSPVGQSETIKHTASSVFSTLNQFDLPPETAADLISFVRKYLDPMLSEKKGDGLIQQFYIMGDIYRASAFKYKNADYLRAAANVYEAGLVLAPKRPQFLYSVLQVYLSMQDAQKATDVTRKILNYWPDDPEMKKFLQGETTTIQL